VAIRDERTNSVRIQALDAGDGSRSASFGSVDLEANGSVGSYAFSPDGGTVAIATGSLPFCEPSGGGSACWDGTEALHLVDLEDGSVFSADLPRPSRVAGMVFAPSGERLALALKTREGSQVMTFSFPDLHLLAQADLPIDPSLCGSTCTSMAYTDDGAEIIVFGADPGDDPGIEPPGPAQAYLLDGDSLAPLWSHTLEGFLMGSWCSDNCDGTHEAFRGEAWYPAVDLSPGSNHLVALHAEADRLTSIDLDRRLVDSVDIHVAQTWLDRLIAWGAFPALAKGYSQGAFKQAYLSPDGSRMYSLGRAYHVRENEDGTLEGWDEPLGLDVIDPLTGGRLGHLDTQAGGLGLSNDGRWILLTHWESRTSAEVLDAATLESRATFDGWQLLPLRSLEGQSLVLATVEGGITSRFAYLDPDTLDRSAAWTTDGWAVVLSP
jgi:hypothetical protein